MEFQLEQWHWWVLALIFVVCIAFLQTPIYIWLTTATTIVGVVVWLDSQTPLRIQLMIFGFITMTGYVISLYFGGDKKDPEKLPADNPDFFNQQQSEQQHTDIVGRTFTLEEPIINGKGTLTFNNQLWKLRGKDADAGCEIRIISFDGIDQTLLEVTQVKTASNNNKD